MALYTYPGYTSIPNISAIYNAVQNSAMTDKAISGIVWDEGDEEIEVTMVNTLSGGDETILDGLVAEHYNDAPDIESLSVSLASEFTDQDNVIKVQQYPRSGDSINYYSPNFCDQTTWYYNSTHIDDFLMIDSGDHLTYNTNGTHDATAWVDLKHGKMFQEDTILSLNPNCQVAVEVSTDNGTNWDSKAENTWGESDGDYNVDYDNAEIIFNSALSDTALVRASFSKSPATFTWKVQPNPGKRVKLMYVEIQFTKDVVMTSSMVYETWVYNPYDLPNKIKVTDLRYKTFKDIAWEATGPYPSVPAVGGSERGLPSDLITMPFHYQVFRDIKSSQGTEIIVTSDKPGPFTGSFASATFYCLQEDDA